WWGIPVRRWPRPARRGLPAQPSRLACRPRGPRCRPGATWPARSRRPGCPRGTPAMTPTLPREPSGGSVALTLWRQILDELRVVVGLADFRRATEGSELSEEVRVDLRVLVPLFGDVVLVVDRLDRADRLAGTAVDAFVWVDIKHPSALIDAVDRAFLDTCLVLDVDAGFGDRVRHRRPLTVSRLLFG